MTRLARHLALVGLVRDLRQRLLDLCFRAPLGMVLADATAFLQERIAVHSVSCCKYHSMCNVCAEHFEGNAMSLRQARKEGIGGGGGKEEVDISFDADF